MRNIACTMRFAFNYLHKIIKQTKAAQSYTVDTENDFMLKIYIS